MQLVQSIKPSEIQMTSIETIRDPTIEPFRDRRAASRKTYQASDSSILNI